MTEAIILPGHDFDSDMPDDIDDDDEEELKQKIQHETTERLFALIRMCHPNEHGEPYTRYMVMDEIIRRKTFLSDMNWPTNPDAIYKNIYTGHESRLDGLRNCNDGIIHEDWSIAEHWLPLAMWTDVDCLDKYKPNNPKNTLLGFKEVKPMQTVIEEGVVKTPLDKELEYYNPTYIKGAIEREMYIWDMRFWDQYHNREEVMEWLDYLQDKKENNASWAGDKNCGHVAHCIDMAFKQNIPKDLICDWILSNNQIQYKNRIKKCGITSFCEEHMNNKRTCEECEGISDTKRQSDKEEQYPGLKQVREIREKIDVQREDKKEGLNRWL